MKRPNIDYRKVSIVLETERAIKFLVLGLKEIDKISASNDFYDPVFLFLSSGLERLYKIMLCLNYLEKNGVLPKAGQAWKVNNGHDLEILKKDVEQICTPIQKPFAAMDYEIVTNDNSINYINKILSEYAKRGRYFHMDVITDTVQEFNPRKEWSHIETRVLEEFYGEDQYNLQMTDYRATERIYRDSNNQIRSLLQLYFRALARQFIHGNFSSRSKTLISQIKIFSHLKDEEIGTIVY